MKKIMFLLFTISLFTMSAKAQCGEELLKLALKDMGSAQYMKDFNIDLKKNKKEEKTGYVKFSVILNSKSQYRFNVANGAGNPEGVILQLYDGDKLIVSNFDSGKMYTSCEFICGTTKVYNLMFSFRGGEEGCARAVLSLVKQYTEAEMKF